MSLSQKNVDLCRIGNNGKISLSNTILRHLFRIEKTYASILQNTYCFIFLMEATLWNGTCSSNLKKWPSSLKENFVGQEKYIDQTWINKNCNFDPREMNKFTGRNQFILNWNCFQIKEFIFFSVKWDGNKKNTPNILQNRVFLN